MRRKSNPKERGSSHSRRSLNDSTSSSSSHSSFYPRRYLADGSSSNSSSSFNFSCSGDTRRVSFKDSIRIREIPSMTRSVDNDPVWYGDHDYDLFQSRDERILRMLGNSIARDYVERIGETSRGLECLVPHARERTMFHRMSAYESVFVIQRERCALQAEMEIAKAYSRACYSAKHDASILGLQDEKFVKQSADHGSVATRIASPNTPPKSVSVTDGEEIEAQRGASHAKKRRKSSSSGGKQGMHKDKHSSERRSMPKGVSSRRRRIQKLVNAAAA